MELEWTIDSVAGDKAKMTQTIRKISFLHVIGDFRSRYDTDHKGKHPRDDLGSAAADVIDPLVGAKTTFTMNVRGEVSDVALKDDDDTESHAYIDVFKRTILQTSILLPAESIGKGATWKRAYGRSRWGVREIYA